MSAKEDLTTLHQRILVLRDRYGMMYDDFEAMNEAAAVIAKLESAKPVASRHLVVLGAGMYTWTRWMDYGEDPKWEVARSEHAYAIDHPSAKSDRLSEDV